MSIWGNVLGGITGTVLGGPIGGVAGWFGGGALGDANKPGPPSPNPAYGPGPNGGYNPWAMPGSPGSKPPIDYKNPYDPSMSVANKMQPMLNNITQNTQGLDKYRQEALRTGPSAWSMLANQQQDAQARAAKSSAATTAAGQTAQANSELAMRGGLDSGARERIAKNSARGYLDATQNINKDVAANKMQIGMNDEQNRISQLGALPGMENQALQPQFQKAQMMGNAFQNDANMQYGANQGLNQFNRDIFNTQMGGWAAGQQSWMQDRKNPSSPNYDDGKRWYNPFSWF